MSIDGKNRSFGLANRYDFNYDQLGHLQRSFFVSQYLDIMRQSACLVLNPITVYSYDFLFNCTTVGQASDSMTALSQGP